MKESRYVALNWAFVVLVAITLVYGIVSVFGTMPALTVGGYQVPVSQKGKEIIYTTMPQLASWFWLFVVPLLAFTVRYFYGLVKTDPKEAKEGAIAGTILGTIAGTILGTILGTMAGTIVGTIIGTMAGTMAGTIAETIVGTIIGTIVGTIQFLIYALFLTGHRIEWLTALPGIAVVLLIANMTLIGFLPMLMAVAERLSSKTFWLAVLGEFHPSRPEAKRLAS